MSKNSLRELRKIIRKKYPCFQQRDIHVGKYKEGRTHCRIYISYDYGGNRDEKIEEIKKLFEPYTTINVEVNDFKTARALSIVFPVEILEAIKGYILLN